eukprot:3149908-Prymnesium_polylepis.1
MTSHSLNDPKPKSRTPPNNLGPSTPTRSTHLGKRAGMAVRGLWHPHRIDPPDITRHPTPPQNAA